MDIKERLIYELIGAALTLMALPDRTKNMCRRIQAHWMLTHIEELPEMMERSK